MTEATPYHIYERIWCKFGSFLSISYVWHDAFTGVWRAREMYYCSPKEEICVTWVAHTSVMTHFLCIFMSDVTYLHVCDALQTYYCSPQEEVCATWVTNTHVSCLISMRLYGQCSAFAGVSRNADVLMLAPRRYLHKISNFDMCYDLFLCISVSDMTHSQVCDALKMYHRSPRENISAKWVTHTRAMTLFYVWHNAFTGRDVLLLAQRRNLRDMSNSCMCHTHFCEFLCATWRICRCVTR